mgnify:CR=1 FL=1
MTSGHEAPHIVGYCSKTGGDINAVFIDPAGTVPNHGDVCVWIDWTLF